MTATYLSNDSTTSIRPLPDPPTISILLVGDAEVGLQLLRMADNQLTFFVPRRISKGIPGLVSKDFTLLRDLDQPFVYDIRRYNRLYRFEFSDTASPDNYTLLQPDIIVLCYDISDQETLENASDRWAKIVHGTYLADRELPVLMLGLKRDLRDLQTDKTVYPQHGLRVAQELRCDRYMECSATTGELVQEVFEDIAKTAALTQTDSKGLSEGACSVM
ncbi:MAG: hypothetical protein M1833_002709 [Piccolia ochrophora]|nr:MAG: hypothetical protein M1833_002709 [Piccolia ochrophora]